MSRAITKTTPSHIYFSLNGFLAHPMVRRWSYQVGSNASVGKGAILARKVPLPTHVWPQKSHMSTVATGGRSQALSLIEKAKQAAAHRAIDENYPSDARAIGIGSGSTVVYAVERIAQLRDQGKIDVSKTVFVPTGFQSKMLILGAGLNAAPIDIFGVGDLDIVVDGADEVDPFLNCIKGGGACLFQEKLVGQCARKFVIVADSSKKSSQLGTKWTQGVPIEVVPMAYPKVTADLLRLGAKEVTLRQGGKAKAGPVVTDNGNFILDTHFGAIEPSEVRKLDIKIKLLVGVVETGLFNYASVAYFGETDGSASFLSRPSDAGAVDPNQIVV